MFRDRIHILVCTYQGGQFIAEQLDSIVAQTYSNFEVHIFDDGSTDKTVSIAEHYSKKYLNFFLHINEKNLGFLKNFENGLKRINGQYIAFSDQDDIWLSDKLACCMREMKLLEQQFPMSPVLVHTDLSLIDSSGKFLFPSFFARKKISLPSEKSLNHIMGHCGVMGNTMLLNRLLVEAALPFPEELKYHDYWLALVNEFVGIRKTIKKPLVKYRMHNSNVSNNTLVKAKRQFYDKWLKRDFELPFLEDHRVKTISYFLDHYTVGSEDKKLLEHYYDYLLFKGSRLFHFYFLIQNNFLKPDLLYRMSVFFRMMLTTRYASNRVSAKKKRGNKSE